MEDNRPPRGRARGRARQTTGVPGVPPPGGGQPAAPPLAEGQEAMAVEIYADVYEGESRRSSSSNGNGNGGNGSGGNGSGGNGNGGNGSGGSGSGGNGNGSDEEMPAQGNNNDAHLFTFIYF
jgi:hypothetical protein